MKPAPLKPIYLVAPSGASPDLSSPKAAIAWLQQQGYVIHNAECIERVEQRFAGPDTQRLDELNDVSSLPRDYVVLGMRGGYGLHRLLPKIDWDALAKAVQGGLQICGHSDLTVLQLGLLAKTGAISLAGPMLNYDFGRHDEMGQVVTPDPFMWEHFQRAIQEHRLDCQVKHSQVFLGTKSAGSLSGILWGGNLTILAGLLGTPYMPSAVQTQGGILFLEDVNEHPYRIERMLMQLLDAGILANQSAILLGGFSAYRLYDHDRGYNLEAAIEMIRSRLSLSIPILTDLPFGHQAQKLTLPVGALAQLAYDANGFSLQSSW